MVTYTFIVTDSYTGLPVEGAQCSIADRMGGAVPSAVRLEGAGCITGGDGVCYIVDPMFPIRYWSVYKAGYETRRGSVVSVVMEVALVPTAVLYWVIVGAGAGGAVDPSGTWQVAANTKLTVTAYPNAGYILDYWLVNNVKSGNTNPLGVTIDRDSFSVYAIFKVAEVPPPPPPPPEWPVTRRLHVFDNVHLKAEFVDVWRKMVHTITAVDLNVLVGGRIDYSITYLRGNEAGVTAYLFWNDNEYVNEMLTKGETITGSIDLTGLIFGTNEVKIGFVSAPMLWSECVFDVWLTLGFSEEPVIEPGEPWTPPWGDWPWYYWVGIGGGALLLLYLLTGKRPSVLVVTPSK